MDDKTKRAREAVARWRIKNKAEWERKNPGKSLEYSARYKKQNPAKNRAHRLVYYGLQTGFIEKGKCEKCGSESTQAHHYDYSKPYDVIWLCKKHHTEVHYIS